MRWGHRQPHSGEEASPRRSDPAWRLSNNGGVTVEAIRSGIDLSYVDAGARPQDDLFGHVNGSWLADHRMPADRATDGAFRLLADRAEEQVRQHALGLADHVARHADYLD